MTLHILVAEDNENAAALLRRAIRRIVNGHRVTFVKTLTAALSKLTSADVLILDLNLPDSPAPATIATLRAISGIVPTIIYSAMNDDPRTVRQCLEAGAGAMLAKDTFTGPAVQTALAAALARSELQQLHWAARAVRHQDQPRPDADQH